MIDFLFIVDYCKLSLGAFHRESPICAALHEGVDH